MSKIAMQPLIRAGLSVGLLLSAMVESPVHATVYSIEYTGTVDEVTSFTGVLPPSDVTVGSAVHGTITFDSDFATAPTYTFTSCSGFCGGDGITGRFRLADHFNLSITIGGSSWAADQGAVDLSDDATVPGEHFDAIIFDDGFVSEYVYSMAVFFNRDVDPRTLFPSVSTLDGLQIPDATSASGFYVNHDFYINYVISLPPTDGSSGSGASATIPAPTSSCALLASLLIIAAQRRRILTKLTKLFSIPAHHAAIFGS